MKLYYSPGACSLASHIVLHETGLPFEAVLASTKTKTLADGTDYRTINPRGSVPLLELDNGERLSEGAVIMQYLADQAPASGLAPANGSWERYRLQEWLNYIGTELHKAFSPLFNPAMPEEGKALARTRLHSQFQWVESQLAGKPYLMGERFTLADAYLFVVSGWAPRVGLDLAPYPALLALRERVAARPAVQAAMKAEGLL